MRRRGSLTPPNTGVGRGWGEGRGMEGPLGTSTVCASQEDGGQEMRGTGCGQRGQAGKGRAGRRWPEMGLCISDNLEMEKMGPWILRCLGASWGCLP